MLGCRVLLGPQHTCTVILAGLNLAAKSADLSDTKLIYGSIMMALLTCDLCSLHNVHQASASHLHGISQQMTVLLQFQLMSATMLCLHDQDDTDRE